MGRDSSGVLFLNDAEEGDDSPYASGKMELEGKEFYLDAWMIKEDGKDQLDIRCKAKGSSSKNGDGDGFMRRNNKGNDKHPDWRGELRYRGNTYKVAGWKRQAKKSGKWFLSLAIQPKEQESREQEEDPNAGYPF